MSEKSLDLTPDIPDTVVRLRIQRRREIVPHSLLRYPITSCPIRRRGAVEAFKGLAFADTDCPECPYCVGRAMPNRIPTEVRCIGHFPKLALKDDTIIRQFGGRVPEREASWQMRPTGIGDTNREADPF